jgi:hypothetical protein
MEMSLIESSTSVKLSNPWLSACVVTLKQSAARANIKILVIMGVSWCLKNSNPTCDLLPLKRFLKANELGVRRLK